MGRHAASEASTVSPPRSNSRALRDLADASPHEFGPGSFGADAPVAPDATALRIGPSSAAPTNRAAVHNRTAVDGRAVDRAAVNPDTAISAAELIARFRESGLLTDTARTQRRRPGAAPAPVQRVKESTGPLRVADLRARHASPLVDKPHGHRAGPRQTSPEPRSATARVLPALRSEPSVRVVVRPVLTVAAIIAAVGLMEAPTLLAASQSGADARPAGTSTTVTGSDGPRIAAVRAAESPDAGPVAVTTAPKRVSRATRSALGVPAKAAAANHVPLMKPGQTVRGTWIRPSTGRYTSCFCARWGSFHAGIDLASPLGTPIVAVGDGTVIKAGPASGFGNWVVIQHANGDVSIYGHMKYFFVHVGQKITAGEKIALVGDQGFSTGPHLHFEIHQGGFTGPKINPIPWLKARGIVIGPRSSDG